MGVNQLETQDQERLKARIDSRDFHAELVGLEIGRIPRFFSSTVESLRNGKDANGKDKLSDLEWLLLNNARYAALYDRTENKLSEAEQKVVQALYILNERLRLNETEIAAMEDRVNTLPDGRKVFRSLNGKAYTADGQELSKAESDAVDWQDDAPSWEEYQAKQKERQKLLENRLEIERYSQDVLDPMRQKIDRREVIEEKELEIFIQDCERLEPPSVKALRKHEIALEPGAVINTNNAKSYFGDTGMNVPNMRRHFDTARMDIPNLSAEPSTPKLSTVPKP
jgi:hypothetical protein